MGQPSPQQSGDKESSNDSVLAAAGGAPSNNVSFVPGDSGIYGPWMLMKRNNIRRPRGQPTMRPSSQDSEENVGKGSRFSVLKTSLNKIWISLVLRTKERPNNVEILALGPNVW